MAYKMSSDLDKPPNNLKIKPLPFPLKSGYKLNDMSSKPIKCNAALFVE